MIMFTSLSGNSRRNGHLFSFSTFAQEGRTKERKGKQMVRETYLECAQVVYNAGQFNVPSSGDGHVLYRLHETRLLGNRSTCKGIQHLCDRLIQCLHVLQKFFIQCNVLNLNFLFLSTKFYTFTVFKHNQLKYLE